MRRARLSLSLSLSRERERERERDGLANTVWYQTGFVPSAPAVTMNAVWYLFLIIRFSDTAKIYKSSHWRVPLNGISLRSRKPVLRFPAPAAGRSRKHPKLESAGRTRKRQQAPNRGRRWRDRSSILPTAPSDRNGPERGRPARARKSKKSRCISTPTRLAVSGPRPGPGRSGPRPDFPESAISREVPGPIGRRIQVPSELLHTSSGAIKSSAICSASGRARGENRLGTLCFRVIPAWIV